MGDWNTVELDNGKEGFVKKENLSDTMPEKDQGESASKDKGQKETIGNQGESASQNNENDENNAGTGENSQPTPTPQPAPEKPQASSGGNINGLTPEEEMQLLLDVGFTVGDVTGEVGVSNFSDHELTIDTSGVTLH